MTQPPVSGHRGSHALSPCRLSRGSIEPTTGSSSSSSSSAWILDSDSDSDATQKGDTHENIKVEKRDIKEATEGIKETTGDIKSKKRVIKEIIEKRTMRSELSRMLRGDLTADEVVEQARIREFRGKIASPAGEAAGTEGFSGKDDANIKNDKARKDATNTKNDEAHRLRPGYTDGWTWMDSFSAW
ncbi:hypothetical protein MaudCBS49596_001587 [Microsporum audouinii]